MPLSQEIARDPPAARRLRVIAPLLVLLLLALVAMVPGVLVHIGSGGQDGATQNIDWPRSYGGR